VHCRCHCGNNKIQHSCCNGTAQRQPLKLRSSSCLYGTHWGSSSGRQDKYIGDVTAAAKVQRLHQLQKLDIIPKDDAQHTCSNCTTLDKDLKMLNDMTTDGTDIFMQSDDSLTHDHFCCGLFNTQVSQPVMMMMMCKNLLHLVTSLSSWTEEDC